MRLSRIEMARSRLLRCGTTARRQDADRRRLPGAVRAEEAEDLARVDLERDAVDGVHLGLRVALDEVLDADETHASTVPVSSVRPRVGVICGVRGDVRGPVLPAGAIRGLERRRTLVDADGGGVGDSSVASWIREGGNAVRAHASGELEPLFLLLLELRGRRPASTVGKEAAAGALRGCDPRVRRAELQCRELRLVEHALAVRVGPVRDAVGAHAARVLDRAAALDDVRRGSAGGDEQRQAGDEDQALDDHATGNATRTRRPPPVRSSATIDASCASAIALTIERPRPRPVPSAVRAASRRWKGSKIRSSSLVRISCPVFATVRTARPFRVSVAISISPPATLWRMEFDRRFATSRSTRRGSPVVCAGSRRMSTFSPSWSDAVVAVATMAARSTG